MGGAAGAIKEDKVDQKAINQLMQSSPEYRQRALCENCERLEKRIKVLEDTLRPMLEVCKDPKSYDLVRVSEIISKAL